MHPLLPRPVDDSQSATEPPITKLKTLEEHRLATRFQEKRVTARTWRKAKKDAYKLLALGERVGIVEALYLLLEIISLRPKGCCLPPLYLNAGCVYLTLDHLEDAAKAYRNCLRLDPASWKARYNLGVALARAQDFVDAKHQFDLALQGCSDSDVARDIQAMIHEIEEVVQNRNIRAFNATQEARTFTTQYLETLHSVVGNPRTVAVEDYTANCRGTPMRQSPLLLYEVHGWQGAIAGLLHRLYTVGYTRSVSIDAEFGRADSSGSGTVTIEQFEAILRAVTNSSLTASEHSELTKICENGYPCIDDWGM